MSRSVVGLLDSCLGEVVPDAPVLRQDVVGGDGDDAEDRSNAVVMQNLLGAAHEKRGKIAGGGGDGLSRYGCEYGCWGKLSRGGGVFGGEGDGTGKAGQWALGEEVAAIAAIPPTNPVEAG